MKRLPPGFHKSESTNDWLQRHEGHDVYKGYADIEQTRQFWWQCDTCKEGFLYRIESGGKVYSKVGEN